VIVEILGIQTLQSVVLQAKKLQKAIYVFSVDSEAGKVLHANYVPDTFKVTGLEARAWAARVADIVGGKVCMARLRR